MVEHPHAMATPELQAIMEMFTQQMRDFAAGVIQQQQTAIQAMLNVERDRPAALAAPTTESVDEKYYKRVESFSGEQAWRHWAFQFKSATKTANEAAYHLLEMADKEEKEIDDELSLSEAEKSLSAAIFNIRDAAQVRTPPHAAHERLQRARGVEEAVQEVQPNYAYAGDAAYDGDHQPRQGEEVGGGRSPH